MKIESSRLPGIPGLRGWMTLLVVLLCSGAGVRGWAQDINTQDYARITQVPRAEMDAWLRQEVTASGGKWDADRYHFYIGFSTGHFGQDPVHAIAMRRVAFSLMNNSLAVGDRVTPIAWEMATWNVGPSVTLTDDPASRTEFVNRVPYAPRAGSQGGHDIERALYETITKSIPADESHSAIVLLLTNTNQSQSPTGEKASLFGADNPQLASAIQVGGFRLPLVRKEFRLQAGEQPVTVALTALFPKKLVSLPGAPTTPRYPTFARETWQPTTDRPAAEDALPNPTRPAAPGQANTAVSNFSSTSVPPGRASLPGWVWIVAALVLLALVAAIALHYSRRKLLVSGDLVVKTPPAVPQAAAIPGTLTVTLGPTEQELPSLGKLTTASAWTLLREADGKVILADVPATPGSAPTSAAPPSVPVPTTLAKLAFDSKRVLRVDAELGAQFMKLQGTAADQSNTRLLLVEPGKKVFGRVLPPDTAVETRIEINYNTPKG